MSGTLSFKVYMRTEEQESKLEVRRFGVEVDAVTSFLYLREKIQTIFPALRGRRFTVSWKDSDGDDIYISSDEELGIFLNESSDEVRKLYVLLHSEYEIPRSSEPTNKGPVHIGITCDGCESSIRGYRYKCIQCQDYDLCAECEASGMHPEHCMIRISTPLQWKPHMGKRLASHVNKFVKRAQQYTAAEEESAQQCPYRSRHGGRPRRAADGLSWAEIASKYLDEWANLPGDCPAREAPKPKDADKGKKKPGPEAAASASAETKCPLSNGSSPSEQIKLLKSVVGENFISQFLDPFLNMHIAAENPETPTSAAANAPAPATSNAEEAGAPVPRAFEAAAAPKFPGEGKKLSDGTAAAAAAAAAAADAATSTNSVTTATTTATANDEAASAVQDKNQSDDKVFVDNELGWTLLNKTDSPSSSSGLSSPNGAVPKQVTPTAPAEASSKSIYPELPTQQVPEAKPVYHSNPTIQKSVETMIAMGFSNNGGWLTNLLVSKGGDIAAALDALSPARR